MTRIEGIVTACVAKDPNLPASVAFDMAIRNLSMEEVNKELREMSATTPDIAPQTVTVSGGGASLAQRMMQRFNGGEK